MFQKVRLRLTLLSGGITTLILIVMTLGYLYISEKNLLENRRYAYQSDVYSIAINLESQSVVTDQWLSQLEAGHDCCISLLDNGSNFLFDTRADDDSRSLLFSELWTCYRQNKEQLSPIAISYKCSYRSFSTADYSCFVITVLHDSATLEMLLAMPLSNIRSQLFHQRLLFSAIIFLALIVLWIFSWLFTGRILKPVEESRKMQNRFIAAASHELRTPLAVILSCAEASLSKIARAEKSDTSVINIAYDITAVKNEALRSARLLNDLLTLTSRDAGHLDIRKAPAELDTLLLDVCEAFERLAAEKRITLTVSLPDELLPPCCCDKERIAQALAILLHNAVSYTPENGSITASVSAARGHFEIQISDTGVGISAADKPHIFERFYRSEKARSDKNHFGLGLSVAYEIVAAHGGSISLADNQSAEHGSVFTVRLP